MQNNLEEDDPQGILSQESSLTAQGLITYNKTILCRPEELVFNQVGVNQAYSQVLTLQNTLSAPVEIVLKSSNQERLELAPKQLKLQPHETCQVTATFRQPRPFPAKTTRQKETIFIKSDFFDQKMAVVIYPAQITASSDTSSFQRAPTSSRQQAFQQATATLSRQQLATTTLGKTAAACNNILSPQTNIRNQNLDLFGQNDSFGRASDFPGTQATPSSSEAQNPRRLNQEFDPSIQQSDHVEVTLAADSKADIVSSQQHTGLGGLGKFESHETSLMRQQLNEIREQNKCLKDELEKAISNQHLTLDSTDQPDQLDTIKALLREREPKLEELLSEAMKIERATQKRKDQKVLEILQFKDQQINELTQAMADHKTLKQMMTDQSQQLKSTEQILAETQERLKQFEDVGGSSEDHFQDLIRSQNKITEQTKSIGQLETMIKDMQSQVDQSKRTQAFYDESIERAKAQNALLQGRLEGSESDLNEERNKNGRLETQVSKLLSQLDKMTTQALHGKDSEISAVTQDRDLQLKLKSVELDNAKLQEQVFQMQDQMQQVFTTLGKVTGDQVGLLLNSGGKRSSKNSTQEFQFGKVSQNQEQLQANSGFDEQLQQRAEEIILIVEQVQAQYTLLEKEMRQLVNKGLTFGQGSQTDLAGTDIDDMHGHFEHLQNQIRAAQNNNSNTNHVSNANQELQQARETIQQLQNALQHNQQKTDLIKQQQQPWLLDYQSSNENLLTNRQSSCGDDKQMGPSEILVSERGCQQLNNVNGSNLATNLTTINQNNRLAFSVNTSNLNQPQSKHSQNGTTSQSNLGAPARQIQEMQDREHQLLDQLSMLKEQMRFQTSHSEANTLGGDAQVFAQEHLQLRIGELETLVFQQREQILQLQDHNGNIRQQLDEKIEENKHKLELYEIRNHNLQELNQKYLEASKGVTNNHYGSGDTAAFLNSYGTRAGMGMDQLGVTSPDYKSTQVETERVKQYAQQQDMKLMDLEHALKEAQMSLKHSQKIKNDLATKLQKSEQDLARVQSDLVLQKAGVNVQDSKLAMLVQELKSKLKRQEQQMHQSNNNLNSASATNTIMNIKENTNQSQSQILQGSSLFALREEYCTKLEKLIEANSEERSNMQSLNLQLKQKVDSQISQFKGMEEKEMRIFTQLEDLRSQKAYDEDHLQKRIKDFESVLDQKQQICSDLEREVKQKDKMLTERQEQLSILLAAMEQQNAHTTGSEMSPLEQTRQKLATMAAELCSLKAVEAQMERKCAEVSHNQTQAYQKCSKLEQQLSDSEVKISFLQRKVQTLESSNELLDRQKQDLSNRSEEVSRDKSDSQYKLERLQFQLKTKEETIACLKSQAVQAEIHFKEQIDRVREDMVVREQKQSFATLGRGRNHNHETTSISTNDGCLQEHRPRREVALKIAIQQLHLVIADYIERSGGDQMAATGVEQAQMNIIAEMEKALGVAQTTIQRLEGDLDRERHKTNSLENEWDALALNGILVTRQERMAAQLKTIGRLLSDRESMSTSEHRQQTDQLNRVIRQQEFKLDSEAKMLTELDSEVQNLKVTNKRLCSENDELQSQILCYTQEQQALRVSLEKKAEITVDERHRQKTDQLKSYLDNDLAKLLMPQGLPQSEVDRLQALSREITAQQILSDKQKRSIDVLSKERDGLESTVRFLKSSKEDQEAKLRDHVNRTATDLAKLDSYQSGANTNAILNKRKQDCLSLEKELIKEREQSEMKSREVTSLMQKIESLKFENMQTNLGNDLDHIAKKKKAQINGTSDEASQMKIQSLQEQLMEIRGCHIQELEELKVQCDVEVSEARRELSQQQRQFESKFMPGTAPGEILDQNHELRERVAKLSVEVDHLCIDGDQMRHQLYESGQQIDQLQQELRDREEAMVELEQVSIMQGRVQSSQGQNNQQQLKSALKRSTANDQETLITNGAPPAIIRELFNAKRNELQAKQKLRSQLQTETKLRQQLTSQIQDDLHQHKNSTIFLNDGQQENTSFVVGEEIVNQLMAQNANIISILQQDINFGNLQAMESTAPDEDSNNLTANTNNLGGKQGQSSSEDFDTLVKAVIYFANQLAHKSVSTDNSNLKIDHGLLTRAPLATVNEAQRIVIRALSSRHSADRIKYAPEDQVDRKVWYLELLEEQVADCENQTNKLQDFVKRLQIGVSGSLHSAAEIKASSMDLANHLKLASDEVKTLRNVTGLIKHDVLSLQEQRQNCGTDAHNMSIATAQDGFNPFLTGRNNPNPAMHNQHSTSVKTTFDVQNNGELQAAHLQQTQRSNMDKLLNEHESMHNQLNLTSRIKQSLETELVQSKLAHASEMQQVIQKMSQAEKKLHDLSQARSQLVSNQKQKEGVIEKQDQEMDDLKVKLSEMEQSMHTVKLEAVKARDSSKHWQKMQSDMQEWRRNHEESLRGKQKQLTEASEKVTKLKADKKRIKAEVGMLRNNHKEVRDGATLDQLKKENSQLVVKFNEQLDERKKEIEFWVQERAQMRDKIDQLESNPHNVNIAPVGLFDAAADGSATPDQVDKLAKKLRSRETDLKQLKSDLLDKKNSLQKAELKLVKLEASVRDANTNLAEAQDKVTLLTNRSKELEIEKEMLIQRQRDNIRAQDFGQIEINSELDKLRSEFAKVKVQKDELELETQGASEREKHWRDSIDKLNRDLVILQNNLTHKEQEYTEFKTLSEKKNSALLSDLKFMRDENHKLHSKLKEANEGVLFLEQQIQNANQNNSEQELQKDKLKRLAADRSDDGRSKDLRIAELQASLQQVETSHFHKVKKLQNDLTELRQESQQTVQIMQSQIEHIKTKLVSEKGGKTSKEVDQSLALTQKDTLLKHAKKDLTTTKAQVAKLKLKNRGLKQELDQIPQRQTTGTNLNANKPQVPSQSRKAQQKPSSVFDSLSLFQQQLLSKLSETNGFEKMLKQSQDLNTIEARLAEKEIEAAKVENWNLALSQQLQEAQSMLEQTEEKINDLLREKKELSKGQKQANSQNDKILKEQLKQVMQELDKVRQEWASPQTVQLQTESITQLSAQVKTLQSEITRKTKLLGQVKQQKEQTSKDQSQVTVELQSLKEENLKLKTQLRDASKNEKVCRDLRGQVDWLTKSEKRLKEEILSLNEKLKSTRFELGRKDQHLKDYKDRMDLIQSEVTGRGEVENELTKLKEQNRRQKSDLEVKENQVKTLRGRLEQNHQEMQTLNDEKSTLTQQDSDLGHKLKTTKQKAKRFETNLQKSMSVIKKIGVELAALHQAKKTVNNGSTQSARFGGSPDNRKPIAIYQREHSTSGQLKQQSDSPMDVDDLTKDAAYFKEGVEILGLSMNEMESFINPGAAAAHMSQNSPGSGSGLISSRGVQIGINADNAGLIEKLERISDQGRSGMETLGGTDIEEIGQHCVRLLSDINQN